MSNSSNYKNSATWNTAVGNVTTVGTNGATSYYGTRDQSGNVWEWTENNKDDNITRTRRGGAWNSTSSQSLSVSGVLYTNYDTKSHNTGFRLAQTGLNLSFSHFLAVSNSGNPADTGNSTNLGSVNYNYSIMADAVTNEEYVHFLNTTDPSGLNTNGLYSSLMSKLEDNTNNPRGGINYTAANPVGSKYSIKTYFENKPVNYVSWRNAAMLCNWLHNGAARSSSLSSGVYDLSSNNITRSENASYFLPNDNEWYKSAFYSASITGYYKYATQNNDEPCAIGSSLCGSVNSVNGNGSVVNSDPTPSPTPQPSISATATPTLTPTISVTPSVTPTISVTPSKTPTNTPTISITASPTQSIGASPTPTITPTISVTPTNTPTTSITPTISVSPTLTPTRTVTPTLTKTPTVTPTKTPTVTPTASVTPTVSLTPSADAMIDNDILDRTYNIKRYSGKSSLNLMNAPSLRYPNDPIVSDWNIFIRNIELVYDNNLYFNTITSGNAILPNPASTLQKLEPNNTYYFISKNTADLPIRIPTNNFDYKSILAPSGIILQLRDLNIPSSFTSQIAASNELNHTTIIDALSKDIDNLRSTKKYPVKVEQAQRLLEAVIEDFENNNVCTDRSFDPTINLPSGVSNNFTSININNPDSYIVRLNIPLNNLPKIDQNDDEIIYELNIIDTDQDKKYNIYPRSGTILPINNEANISAIINLWPTPTPSPSRSP